MKKLKIFAVLLGCLFSMFVPRYSIKSYAGEPMCSNNSQQWWYRKDDGSYAKSEWVKVPWSSKWRYTNRFGNIVEDCNFQVGEKVYHPDSAGDLVTNTWIYDSKYYADEDGALREGPGGAYITHLSYKYTCDPGFGVKSTSTYDSDYQLTEEDFVDDEGRKVFYRYEYDSNGNLAKFKFMGDDKKVAYTAEYTYDKKNVIKTEFKDVNGNVKLVYTIHYDENDHKDGLEFFRSDGTSILKLEPGSRYYNNPKKDVFNEWDKFIAETCPEGSMAYEHSYERYPFSL